MSILHSCCALAGWMIERSLLLSVASEPELKHPGEAAFDRVVLYAVAELA